MLRFTPGPDKVGVLSYVIKGGCDLPGDFSARDDCHYGTKGVEDDGKVYVGGFAGVPWDTVDPDAPPKPEPVFPATHVVVLSGGADSSDRARRVWCRPAAGTAPSSRSGSTNGGETWTSWQDLNALYRATASSTTGRLARTRIVSTG